MAIKKSSRQDPRRNSGTRKPGKRRPSKKVVPSSDPSSQRLNKVLAAAGLGSRRDVEELIVQGRVEIDRETVTDLSRKVDPRKVTIKVDGSVLRQERLVYHALNKPTGVLSTNRDPDGRMRVIDLVPGKERVFSVGRLDRSSEGLILLTNDGELAQRLAHPKFAVQKSYFVVVSGIMEQEELNKLRKGVHLSEGFARIDGATIRRQRKGCTELEITLSEGKNREIRRILARAGHKVVVLRRISIGPLRLGQLPVGASRQLNSTEVKALYAATQQKPTTTKNAAKRTAEDLRETATRPAEIAASLDDEDDFEMSMDDEAFDSATLELSDDDFVGHFSSSTAGRVLSYDDDSPATSKKSPRNRQAKGAGRRSTASGSKGESGSRRASGQAEVRDGASRLKSRTSSGSKPKKASSKRSAPMASAKGSAEPRRSAGTKQSRPAKQGPKKQGGPKSQGGPKKHGGSGRGAGKSSASRPRGPKGR